MKKTLNEFKDFIARGNVMDMAVGVIVGGAFGKIVTSLVNDMLMPLIGLLLGGVDLTKMYLALDGKTYANPVEAAESGAPILAYGKRKRPPPKSAPSVRKRCTSKPPAAPTAPPFWRINNGQRLGP